jgi:ATP-binding cassette subfamily C protein EexD
LLVEAGRESGHAYAALSRTLGNADTIEALGMLSCLRERWRERSYGVLAAQSRASERGGRWIVLSRMVRMTVQSSMLGVGAWLVLENEMTGGLMVAGSILLGRALAPLDQLTGVWKQFVTARERYRRLNELLNEFPMSPPRMSLPAPTGHIKVENLTVVPPGAKLPALRGVSFEVQPGEIVGVVGPSASGKSTLARALLGVWPPLQGTVRLDGADAFGWNRAELGPHVGYLPQEIELFEGSIAENIARFGTVDSQEVVAAATLAGIHYMILEMPQGYDLVIGGPNGGVLSGGQRQRLGFARAIYGNPKVVVLDEPNANLDQAGDVALRSALVALKKRGTTVVVITHRPNLLAIVDHVLVLAAGQLLAFGPRDRMLVESYGAQSGVHAQQSAAAGGQPPRAASAAPQIVPIRKPESTS